MRKILIILLLTFSLTAWADKWYVATTGSDTHGKGTLADPWLTLKHAADTVTGAAFVGDTIVVGAGTFTENTQIALGVGVSLRGAGATTIITSGAALNPIIYLASASENTAGNQSISNLTLDGNLTALTAIYILARGNVKLHDLTVIDFVNGGVGFRGGISGTHPTTHATGNEVYNCTITNSATRSGSPNGLIWISGQQGILIHDNVLDQTGRAEGSNGNIINAVGGGSEANSGFNDGVKYYRNKSYKPYSDGTAWNFHIESWDATGWEIYDNDFNGGGCHIDIGGYYNTKGSYNYSFYIHGNRFTQNAVQPNNADIQTMGIDIESNTSDVIITGNYFKNLQFGIYHSLNLSRAQNNIRVSYNVFESIGLTDNIWAGPIMIAGEGTAPAYTNLFYDNNTMTASTAYNVGAGVTFGLYAGSADARIRNNIIKGFMRPVWVAGTTNPDTVYYQNNQSNNTSDNIYYSSGRAIGTLISADNQTGDPVFVTTSDLHLQSTSPCRDAGIDVSAITGGKDFHGASLYGTAYDIGAFEYGTGRLMILNDTIVPTINYKAIKITH